MSKSTWSEVFSSLPEQGFFEAVRHYLGPVSTPFHKPDLVNRMEAFFKREDVRERVRDFINEDDALFLSFIAFNDGVTEQKLRGMSHRHKYIDFRLKLQNLEERLLVWGRTEGRSRRYRLSPLGLMVKDSGYLGPAAVIGNGIAGDGEPGMPWFDDNFLTSALAFLADGAPLFRKEGGWRKKALENARESFPSLFRDDRGSDRLLMVGRGLLASGLAERKGEALLPIIPAWREMEGRSSEDRLALLKTRAAVGRTVPVENAVQAIRLLIEHLPADLSFAAEDLATLFQMAAGPSAPSPAGAARVIAHLELMGELNSCGEGRLMRTQSPSSTAVDTLNISAAGDISLRPGSRLFCDLALAAAPVNLDIVAGFSMEKGRFQSGLDHGVNPENLIMQIKERSGRPVPPNIRTLVTEWTADHKELDLKIGVVVSARGLRKQIIEETGVLESYTFARPSEDVWILDPSEEEAWRQALAEVGMDRLPPLKTPSGIPLQSLQSQSDRKATQLPWHIGAAEHPLSSYPWQKHELHDITPILLDLKKSADKVSLSHEEKEAFVERLERRLILLPEQIRKGAWRYEVMSAKGLDYRGKIRLVEAAISGKDDRLSVSVAAGNAIETILVMPHKLEKEGDDHVLVGTVLPEEEEARFKIRKIGFLRRIKTSLF